MLDAQNEAMLNEWAVKNGVLRKEAGGVITTGNTNFSGTIPKPTVEQLISMTRAQTPWLSEINMPLRDRSTGQIHIIDWTEPAMEYVGENDGTAVGNRPAATMVTYACKKFRSDLYLTTEEIREAAAAGFGPFEQKMTEEWTKQLGNDLGHLIWNGNTALNTSSRMNRMLRGCTGVDIQTTNGANVFDAAGKAFDQGIFAVMLDYMPDKYANDPGLKWFFNRRVNTHWHATLTNTNTTERMRSALGDQVLTTEVNVKPLGIPQLIVPQISSNKGDSAAPTAVTDGTTNIVFRVNSILADSTNSAGRKVKVTYKPSGMSEVLTVTYNGSSQNIVTTAGLLGQSTVSTTASDYVVQVYDLTDIYLGNPKGIWAPVCSEWRSYREFNKDFDRYEITTYFEVDVLVPVPVFMVKFRNVRVTQKTTW